MKQPKFSRCEPQHEISNNVVCATSKGSDQPAHTHTLGLQRVKSKALSGTSNKKDNSSLGTQNRVI